MTKNKFKEWLKSQKKTTQKCLDVGRVNYTSESIRSFEERIKTLDEVLEKLNENATN